MLSVYLWDLAPAFVGNSKSPQPKHMQCAMTGSGPLEVQTWPYLSCSVMTFHTLIAIAPTFGKVALSDGAGSAPYSGTNRLSSHFQSFRNLIMNANPCPLLAGMR